jgi:amino acid transporter
LITAVLATMRAYAAQLVCPDTTSYPDVDTAYVHVAGRAGGPALLQLVNFTLLIASAGAGIAAQLAAARLLYGMGRDNAIPRSFFAFIDTKNQIPRNNSLFIGAIALSGAYLFTYQLAGELVNFGAYLAFMGVNASAFTHYWLRAKERYAGTFLTPLLGFLVCLAIWLSLRWPAKLAGALWVITGIVYAAFKTNGFREGTLQFVEPTESDRNGQRKFPSILPLSARQRGLPPLPGTAVSASGTDGPQETRLRAGYRRRYPYHGNSGSLIRAIRACLRP